MTLRAAGSNSSICRRPAGITSRWIAVTKPRFKNVCRRSARGARAPTDLLRRHQPKASSSSDAANADLEGADPNAKQPPQCRPQYRPPLILRLLYREAFDLLGDQHMTLGDVLTEGMQNVQTAGHCGQT